MRYPSCTVVPNSGRHIWCAKKGMHDTYHVSLNNSQSRMSWSLYLWVGQVRSGHIFASLRQPPANCRHFLDLWILAIMSRRHACNISCIGRLSCAMISGLVKINRIWYEWLASHHGTVTIHALAWIQMQPISQWQTHETSKAVQRNVSNACTMC